MSSKMHHLYPTSTGDQLCPLGFHPQVRWPTRCKRCFRDYKDHKDHVGKKPSKDTTASSPSLSAWEPSNGRSSSEDVEPRRNWSSTSNLSKEESGNGRASSLGRSDSSLGWSSAMDVSSASLSDLRASTRDSAGSNDVPTVTLRPPRPKTYAGGSSSDSLSALRRFSVDESSSDRRNTISGTSSGSRSNSATSVGAQLPPRPPPRSDSAPHKLQIKSVIDKSNGTNSDNDAEFVIQVRKSRITERNGAKTDSAEKDSKGGKPEKQDVEKLKSQLSDMRSRCERLEKEKADILLRRISTIDSSKPLGTDVLKLQKSVKELQTKNDALSEEKRGFAAKIKSLEKELGLKAHKGEKERAAEELRSKLKAAETLCESLMDENEDMKKEIRELEEEIYEMQDNFREEQADEYTTIRKNLEQSNKNCRILSFKLRKIERKAEQLEADKTDLEQKYEQVKRIEEILKKVGSEYKNRSLLKKPTEFSHKMQLKRLADGMEKDIGEVINVMVSMMDGRDLGTAGSNFKYDRLSKEHEILKEKLDKAQKELALEREAKKTKPISSTPDDPKKQNDELASLRKKLEESQGSRDLERKSWDAEKVKLQEEKEKLKSKLLSLSADKLKVYNEVVQLKKDLETATSSKRDTAKMETSLTELKKELAQEKERSRKLQDEIAGLAEKETKLGRSLTTAETAKIQLENDLKQTKLELENIKNSTSTKISEITNELDSLRKEKEKLKNQLEKEKQLKDVEIATLKKKNLSLEKAGLNSKKLEDLKQTYDEKITNLENDVKRGTQQYDELISKYGKLAEQKQQLEKENQLLNGQLIDHRQDYITLQAELQELRQSYKAKENEWSAQKLRLEEQLRSYEKTAKTVLQGDLREENLRLKRESSSLTQQIDDLKRANDDLSGKLADYQHVGKVQRNLVADSSALDSELRRTKNALENADRARKAELAACKLRYEQRVSAIGEELKGLQAQLARYKRERDTYRQMLDGAQKSIAELKSSSGKRSSASRNASNRSSEDEEGAAAASSAKCTKLEQQVAALEDELSEARLDASKLKTELASEKSAWDIKLSEMQSRVNELEEDRLLSSGRTKIPGLKVRMELAWQKEREDQQRLLQETATLARDLRQTLFEVERERDKERLENKRKQDQLKKIFDEEKDENKKKLVELQCDLLELRDAHAKLRTSNEKMRREKERHEREREELRAQIASRRRSEQTEARNLNALLQQVDDLMRLFPGARGGDSPSTMPDSRPSSRLASPDPQSGGAPDTPTPPRRLKGPKSRESSPMLQDSREDVRASSVAPSNKTEKLEYTIKKLMEVAKELRQSKRIADESSSRSRKLSKRSSSIDNDTGKAVAPSRSKPSLKRKSLSLEQTSGKNDQSIWGNNSNVSSLQSLNGSEVDSRHYSLQRDSSIESHLSTESTQSEILRHDKKHSKGIIRKITTKLTKSASVDDPNSSYDNSLQTSGSEASITDAMMKKEKKNLKKKLSNMFKRGSKSNGLDKKQDSRESIRSPSRMSTVSART